jgi:hypothetical protein
MYLAAAHDPNDTRHATLRPPSHHDMHAQYVNPGALVPRTARILAAIDLVAATESHLLRRQNTPSCTAYFVYASTRNHSPR